MDTVTIVGAATVLFYCIIQVLGYYGVGMEVYGGYLFFYLMLLMCMILLPKDIPAL